MIKLIKPVKTLYVIRGLPGSGKTTYATAIGDRLGIRRYEADMYFMDSIGNYMFNAKKLPLAHEWCGDKVYGEMVEGQSVIVSNTFTTWNEMKSYIECAPILNFRVKIIQMNGKWNSTHGVPEKTVEKMTARFVQNKLLPQLDFIEYSEVY